LFFNNFFRPKVNNTNHLNEHNESEKKKVQPQKLRSFDRHLLLQLEVWEHGWVAFASTRPVLLLQQLGAQLHVADCGGRLRSQPRNFGKKLFAQLGTHAPKYSLCWRLLRRKRTERERNRKKSILHDTYTCTTSLSLSLSLSLSI